jgi:D-arabinose 1-dehydrogenase-like Zn-dependent alcohol dehydrogenase
MVPGHEITGVVEQVGKSVKHFRVGDRVGVGCMVDSCLSCKLCMLFLHISLIFIRSNHVGKKHLEQHCSDTCYTYNSTELDKVTPTYGGKYHYRIKIIISILFNKGYSNFVTVKEHFVCKIPKNLPLDAAAPLLCAGITTYSPLRRYNVGKNTRMGYLF